MSCKSMATRSSFFSRKAGRKDALWAQLDFWPEPRTRTVVTLGRLPEVVKSNQAAALVEPKKCLGVCPQRSEDSRPGTSRRISPPSNTGMNK